MAKKKNKTEMSAYKKGFILELISVGLGLILCVLAINLIILSVSAEGWIQNLLLGLGTGAAMSALVSWIFYINDKLIKKRECLKIRISFMADFKGLYYIILRAINFNGANDTEIGAEEYIKKQHRWYHDYYKRMVAGSDTEEETELRERTLRNFMAACKIKFNECFEYNINWKNGEYSDWQRRELSYIYTAFKNTEIYLEQGKKGSAFFEFAYFLECIKRLISEFEELESFGLIGFGYDKEGRLTMNTEKFEEKEPTFKFAREFQEIRLENYKKQYASATADSESGSYVFS